MKIGVTSLTFENYSVDEVVKYVKEAGLTGIEWGVSEKHMQLGNKERANEIKALSEENGIEIFSLGSYCHMETTIECEEAVEAAVMLNAPVVRTWAGTKSPNLCSEEYKATVIKNSRYMAELASRYNIKIGFEYHEGSLTETLDSAIKLVQLIDKENIGLYWQPKYTLTAEENYRERDLLLPYCVGNIHIQNYDIEKGYGLLKDITESLQLYFDDIKNQDYNLMIEFVKDEEVESLIDDAKTLNKLFSK